MRTNKKAIFILSALSVMLFSMVACSSMRETKFKEADAELVDGVSFLSFKVFKKEGQIQLEFVKRTDAEIVLKESEVYTKTATSKYIIQLRSEKNKPLQEYYLEDVLNPQQELFQEGGSIESHPAHLNEKDFTLRVPRIKDSYSKVFLYEIDSMGHIHYLCSSKTN